MRWSNKLINGVQAYLTHALVAADLIREYSRSFIKNIQILQFQEIFSFC